MGQVNGDAIVPLGKGIGLVVLRNLEAQLRVVVQRPAHVCDLEDRLIAYDVPATRVPVNLAPALTLQPIEAPVTDRNLLMAVQLDVACFGSLAATRANDRFHHRKPRHGSPRRTGSLGRSNQRVCSPGGHRSSRRGPSEPRTASLTYCLALRLHEGMLFLADTRTNAGVDNIGTYRKMHVLQPAEDRVFVIESAGSLATTQQVLDRMARDLGAGEATESLATVGHLFEAALYLGRVSREVANEHKEALGQVGADGTATFILGGHVGDEEPDILLVYPEGNYIRASDERPFLQIGESKYGKFMLELAVEAHVDLVTAAKIALGSMLSTAAANLSVGPPYDIGFYFNDTRTLSQFRIDSDSPLLEKLQKVWERHLVDGIAKLPAITQDDLTEIDDPIEIEIIESTE